MQDRYGECSFADVPTPEIGPDQVLVRVRAASVNAYDWHVLRGDPRLARLSMGLTRPRARIRGRDFAGQVVAAGSSVTRFRPGDEVFGDTGTADGTFAEFVAVREELVADRPAGVPPEAAAALPLAGVTARQALRDVRAGHRVLINGASGGVGTFAVQLAVASGAAVTAVCSARNAELVRSLGAAVVVDYRQTDVTTLGERYDVVLDLVGNRSLAALRTLLTPGGTLVLSGGGVYRGGSVLGPMRLILWAQLVSRFARQRITVLTATTSRESLEALAAMVAEGRITVAIDRTFPLAAAADAIRYLETEHARAKVVVTTEQ